MRKVLSVFGTRPEAIKMAPVIRELARYPDRVESLVCITAQHREMLDQVLRLFDIRPDIDLNLMQPDQALTDLTAQALTGITGVLETLRPDVVLVQGDTTTVIAAALAAFYQRIPVGHVEAGLRTGDRYSPFPEEINRRLATVLATYHFAPTETAAAALRSEGIPQERIYVTGNTVVDALLWAVSLPEPAEVTGLSLDLGLSNHGDFFSDPRSRTRDPKLILVTAHRRENLGVPFEEICHGLRELARRNADVRIVYPVHLNPHVREPAYRLLGGRERVHLIEPLSYLSFAHLMKRAYLVLTDSGGIQEEAPALGVPVLVLRQKTERPEAVAAGTVKLVGPCASAIVKETERLLGDERAYACMANAVSPYGDGHAAERIVRILLDERESCHVQNQRLT